MFAMWLQSGSVIGSLGSLALPILFFVALYFLMIAPNQRKQKSGRRCWAVEVRRQGDHQWRHSRTVLTVKDDVVILRVQPDGVKLEFGQERDCHGHYRRNRPPEAGICREIWCIEFEMYAG